MAFEQEAGGFGAGVDTTVEGCIGEFGDRAALAAGQVVVVAAFADLVADSAVFHGNSANDVDLLQELHRAEDRSAANSG